MRWDKFRKTVESSGLLLFTPRALHALLTIGLPTIRNFLWTHAKRGDLVRLKRGLYMLPDRPPSILYIANKLYEPSYISLEAALSFHGVIPETVYGVTSVTTKKSRTFELLNTSFSYRQIKKEAFTGYDSIPYQGVTVSMAEAEKALVDYIYLAVLSGDKLSHLLERIFERLEVEKLNKPKALNYARLFNDERIVSIIKERLQ